MRTDPNALETFTDVTKFFSQRLEKDARILDLGAGGGNLLESLQSAGFSDLAGAGYDITLDDAFDCYKGLDLSHSDIVGTVGEASWDGCVATDVIEHLCNPFYFLTQIRRLLKPGAILCLTFPNVHRWRSIVGFALNGRHTGFFGHNFNNGGHPVHDQHIFIPNMHLIRYFLNLTGFTGVEVSYVKGYHRLMAQTTMVTCIADGTPYEG